MDQRKLQILGAIVEDYVDTREPVGSKSLLERHDLGVSAATVRNDMSVLEDEGLIEYRRVEGVPVDEMPGVYGTADIVVDQFGAADYGVAACEAMAAGRVVVSHIAQNVRDHVRRETSLDLPIVQADPETLRDVIVRLVEDRVEGRAAAAAGPAFVEAAHDGRLSAEVLSRWFDETNGSAVPLSGPSSSTK